MNQRSGRMVVLTGAAIFGGLLLGSVGAAAGSAPAEVDTTDHSSSSETTGDIRALAESDPVTVDLTPKVTLLLTTTTTAAPAPTTAAPAAAAAAPAPTTTAPAPEPVAAPAPSSSVEEAIAAWFPDVYEKAVRVAQCESSLNPSAVSAGGGNHGLFQINSIHADAFTAVTGQPWSAVYDAYYNSQFARYLYDQSGWQPWGCRYA